MNAAPIIIVSNGAPLTPEYIAELKAQLVQKRPADQVMSIGEAIPKLLAAKLAANRRPVYVKSLKNYLGKFAKGRESKPLHEFTIHDFEDWFQSRGEKAGTRKGNEGHISALFQFAVRKGWVDLNPCRRFEPITIERGVPFVLSPRQAARLLIGAKRRKPCALAYFTLALMGGLRPDEISAISWDDIDLDTGTVTVSAAASKVRRRRVVHLQPAALAWLKLADEMGSTLPVSVMSRRRYTRIFACQTLGFETFPHDCLRHTAATYLLGLLKNQWQVASELGNSPSILMTHYVDLRPESEAKKFWSVLPRKKPRHLVNGWRSFQFVLGRDERRKRRLERIRAAMVVYRAANPEKIKEQRATYRKEHREKIRASRSRLYRMTKARAWQGFVSMIHRGIAVAFLEAFERRQLKMAA